MQHAKELIFKVSFILSHTYVERLKRLYMLSLHKRRVNTSLLFLIFDLLRDSINCPKVIKENALMENTVCHGFVQNLAILYKL